MAKTRVSFSISDTELENTLTELMEKRFKDYCEDSMKHIIDKALNDKFTEAIMEKVSKRLESRYANLDFHTLVCEAVREAVSNRVHGVWSDFNDEIQQTIEDSIKKTLTDGEDYINDAIRSQFKGMVNAFVKEFKPIIDDGGNISNATNGDVIKLLLPK